MKPPMLRGLLHVYCGGHIQVYSAAYLQVNHAVLIQVYYALSLLNTAYSIGCVEPIRTVLSAGLHLSRNRDSGLAASAKSVRTRRYRTSLTMSALSNHFLANLSIHFDEMSCSSPRTSSS